MKVAIGSDKSGFTLKEAIKAHLAENGIEYVEVGTLDLDHVKPFYVTAPEVAEKLLAKDADFGILICGTGMGMSQVANKYKGIRAACVESTYAARMCRAINDSNVLCLGGWEIAPELGLELVDTFLKTGHTEGLEPWRQDFLKNALHEFQKLEDKIYQN